MIKIAICDDVKFEINKTFEYINKYIKSNGNFSNISVEKFNSSIEILEAIKVKNQRFDILLLDIIMPEIDGITLAKEIRYVDDDCFIVFLTTSDDYALKAYEVNAFQYLIKPFEYSKFSSVLDKIIGLIDKTVSNSILVNTKDGVVSLKTNRIVYIEHINHVLYIHLNDKSVIATTNSSISLSDFFSLLSGDNKFMMPHRAYIINLTYVDALTNESFLMTDGTEIFVSKRKHKEIKENYINFLLSRN